jgi:hypothetical protein
MSEGAYKKTPSVRIKLTKTKPKKRKKIVIINEDKKTRVETEKETPYFTKNIRFLLVNLLRGKQNSQNLKQEGMFAQRRLVFTLFLSLHFTCTLLK